MRVRELKNFLLYVPLLFSLLIVQKWIYTLNHKIVYKIKKFNKKLISVSIIFPLYIIMSQFYSIHCYRTNSNNSGVFTGAAVNPCEVYVQSIFLKISQAHVRDIASSSSVPLHQYFFWKTRSTHYQISDVHSFCKPINTCEFANLYGFSFIRI